MTRHQLGWTMVGVAVLLLAVQLVPAQALRARPRPATAADSTSASFHVHRLAPTQDSVFLARSERPTSLEIVGWQGAHAGDLRLPATVGPLNPGWGFLQSPSGARFLDGTLLLDITGDTVDLGRLVDPAKVSGFQWRDDSEGACAVRDDGGGAASLVEFVFNPHRATTVVLPLPAGFGFADETGPRVLACNRARRVALVGLVALDHSARVVVLDLVTGEELGRRSYPPGSAAAVLASPDGTLLALNAGPDLSVGAAGPTVVREVDSDHVVLVLGAELTVRAFSADSRAVVASSPFQAGAEVVRVRDGARLFSDRTSRVLLGAFARPRSDDFALALGTRDDRTCTKGEPGKFPQFCRYGPLQLLEMVASDAGTARDIGVGVGSWGYQVN